MFGVCIGSMQVLIGISLSQTGYGLDGRVRFPAVQDLSLLHVVQTGSGTHPASNPMGTGGSFPGVKRPGREVDHSPPSSAEVKNTWSYISTPPYVFMM
jgi:hypothetical protein